MVETVSVKKYAVGRIYFYAKGDPKYKKEAEKALECATSSPLYGQAINGEYKILK
jgi:hypothetical protein